MSVKLILYHCIFTQQCIHQSGVTFASSANTGTTESLTRVSQQDGIRTICLDNPKKRYSVCPTYSGRKKGNVLFSDATNLFYLWYMALGIWYMTTQIVREETCCCHYMEYPFRLAAMDLYIHHPKDSIAHIAACIVDHWQEWANKMDIRLVLVEQWLNQCL